MLRVQGSRTQKILVSIKFVSTILGPAMAAPILWAPGKNAFFFFCRKTYVHKIPRFGGGGFWVLGGGGKCRFYFYGRGDFSDELNPFLRIALRGAKNCESQV